MEAVPSSEMLLSSTWHHIPKDGAFLNKFHENHVSLVMFLGTADT
jgi:hypothetical protein